MANRVSASITLGGTLSSLAYEALTALIAAEALSTEWDGEPFEADHHVPGTALSLFAHEVANGRFEALEAWCAEHGIAFARWSGAYPSQWGAERVVFTGAGEPVSYPVDEDDYVVIGRAALEHLASFDAVLAYFDAADFVVPPLVVGDGAPVPQEPLAGPGFDETVSS